MISDEELNDLHKISLNFPEHSLLELSSTDKSTISTVDQLSLSNKDSVIRLDDIIKFLTSLPSSENHAELLSTCFSALPKYLADSLPEMQEKALDCLLIFANKLPITNDKSMTEIFDSIMSNSLAGENAQLKTKARNCILTFAENKGMHSMIVSSIKKTLTSNASTKITVAGITISMELLRTFGKEYFPVGVFAELIVPLVNSTNIQIRTEALIYLKEACKWDYAIIEKIAIKINESLLKECIQNIFTEIKEKPIPSVKSEELSRNETSAVKKHLYELIIEAANSELPKIINYVENEKSQEIFNALKQLLYSSDTLIVNTVLAVINKLTISKTNEFLICRKDILEAVFRKFDTDNDKTLTLAKDCVNTLISSMNSEDIIETIKVSLHDSSSTMKVNICSWIKSSLIYKLGDSLDIILQLLQNLANSDSKEVKSLALSCINVIQCIKIGEKQRKENDVQDKDKQELESMESAASKIDDSALSKSFSKSISASSESRTNKSKKHRKASANISRGSGKGYKIAIDAIVEEDIGPKMSSELSTRLVYENLPPTILAYFDMNDTKGRQKGLKNLNNWVQSNQSKAQQVMEAIMVWLKRKSKEFREGEIMESLMLIKTFCSVCTIDKRFAREAIPMIIERMSDLRLHKECTSIIMLISDSINPSYVSILIMKMCHLVKNCNMIKGSLLIFCKMLEEYGAGLLPIKITIDYAKYYLSSNNSLIHTAALKYIVLTYKTMGGSVKPWIYSDLKDNVAKIIDAELAKIIPHPISEISRNIKNETAELQANCKDPIQLLSKPVNVSSQINYKIIAGLLDSSVKQRQEAKDAIEKILSSSNNCISASGLGPLIGALKEKMNEPYKKLAKAFIRLVGNLASAVGQEFGQYCKVIVQPLMCNLADRQAAIRSETMTAMDKIANAVGPECILNDISSVLEKGNFEMRNALLIWIMNNREFLRKCDEKSLVRPLISTLNDKSKEIRTLSEQVIKEVVGDIGYKAFVCEIQDARLLERLNLKTILNKYKTAAKENAKPEIYNDNFENKKVNPLELAINNTVINKSREVLNSCKNQRKYLSGQTRIGPNSSVLGKSLIKKNKHMLGHSMHGSISNLNEIFKSKPRTKLNDFKRVSRQISRHSSRFLSRSGVEDFLNSSNNLSFAESIVVSKLGSKDQRNVVDKCARWPINEIRKDYLETLKKTLKVALNPTILDLMFSNEVKKNCHAIGILTEGLKTEFDSLLDLFDLFCKWIIIKLIDQTNTMFIKDAVNFVEAFFNNMIQAEYKLYDFEAAAIIPILCEKLGTSKLESKEKIKELIKLSTNLYHPAKVVNWIIWTLDATRNKKTKLECLILINEFAKKYTANDICSLKNIKSLVKYISSIESSLRSKTSEILSIFYKTLGNTLWIILGDVPENIKLTLENKLDISEDSDLPLHTTKREGQLSISNTNLITSLRMHRRKKSNQKRVQGSNENFRTRRVNSVFSTDYMTSRESTMNHKGIKNSTINISSEAERSYSLESSLIGEKRIMSLKDALEVIRHGEISRRVEALMYLNEKIVTNLEEEKQCLVTHCDQLLNSFSAVLEEIFTNEPKDIPVRFAKYFMTVVSKICSYKSFISKVKEKSFSTFAEQLLTKLLYDGLEKLGDGNEGEYLVKALNSTMLKVLEYYDPTSVFVVLINLLKKYKNAKSITQNIRVGRLPGLIVKCMLKMAKMIGAIIDSLEVSRILLALHEYLILNPKSSLLITSNDDIGIRIAKTIIYELINAKGEMIWQDYRSIELHKKPDVHIKRWISLLLKSTHPISASPTSLRDEEIQPLKEIVNKLKCERTYQEGIERLNEYITDHPETDLMPYFASTTQEFQERVNNSLEQFQKQEIVHDSAVELKESVEVPEEETLPSVSVGSSLSEYKSKLALLKQKFTVENKE